MDQRWRDEYNAKNNEVELSARKDKRKIVRDDGCITKSITGERRKQEVGVKDKLRVARTETRERVQRWVEQY